MSPSFIPWRISRLANSTVNRMAAASTERAGTSAAPRRHHARARRASRHELGRDRKPCSGEKGEADKRRRAVEAIDAVVERDQNRERRQHGGRRPDQRREDALVAALRAVSGGAEQHRKERAE